MYTYIDNHLQQRKSSLSSLTRTKKQQSKAFQSIKNQQNILSKQQSQQYIKSQQKSIMKSHTNDNINAIRLQDQQSLSIKKCTPQQRLREQQSSDYIRNLYKKYLGKENKQPVDKLNAFTERKLKTTESKQVIATTTNNTTGKEFARRTLFTVENESNVDGRKEGVSNGGKGQDVVGLMRKEKTKISHIVSIQSQSSQTPYHQQPHKSSISHNNDTPKPSFQSSKKDSIIVIKKQDKQNYQKQCQSKKSNNKNFKSKSKLQQQQQLTQEQSVKSSSVVLKRSQSTHVRLEKSQIEGNNRRSAVKGTGVEVSLSKGNAEKSKIKEGKCQQSVFVHPHRQSYCQFDTEQEIHSNDNHQSQALNELNLITKSYQPLLNERRRSTTASTQVRSTQNLNHQLPKQQQLANQPSKGDVFLRYINDLSTLQMITGRESSLFQTLQKINNIKNKKNVVKQENKLFEQKQINFEQRLMVNHRLIL